MRGLPKTRKTPHNTVSYVSPGAEVKGGLGNLIEEEKQVTEAFTCEAIEALDKGHSPFRV